MVNVQQSLGALNLSGPYIWPLHKPGLHDNIGAILLRPIFLFSAITTWLHHGSSSYNTVHRKKGIRTTIISVYCFLIVLDPTTKAVEGGFTSLRMVLLLRYDRDVWPSPSGGAQMEKWVKKLHSYG